MVHPVLVVSVFHWFQRIQVRPFLVHLPHGQLTAHLLLYVDDTVLTASDTAFLQWIIAALRHEFSMTDLDSLHCFLGIAAHRTTTGLFLSQEKYAAEILERASMSNRNPCATPLDCNST
uniref:Reverse transcriptase Ty1/copia-type domain-containing protein n=1 Tax=Arundo donax TaxID=35708 RepID=A0A0A8Z1V0_ARUDO